MNPKISIIVPVYKVEIYLSECIDSILAQTFSNFELILIDDGSPDGCPQICDDFAQRDSRIKVIHKKNDGVSSARNVGLSIAKGEYIGFVDSDDVISNDMYQVLYDVITTHDADLVSCGYRRFSNENEIIYHRDKDWGVRSILIDDSMEVIKKYSKVQISGADASVCNKLYRKECIDQVFFPRMRAGEDSVFNAKASLKIKSLVEISNQLYFYRDNPEGVCNNSNIETDINNIEKMKIFLMIIKSKPEMEEYYKLQLNEYAKKLIFFYTKNKIEKNPKRDRRFFFDEYALIYTELKEIKKSILRSIIYILFKNFPEFFSGTVGKVRYYVAIGRGKKLTEKKIYK